MLVFIAFTILSLLAAGQAWHINRPIVGGKDCHMGEFPFMASLRTATGSHEHQCGCTILNPNWVLSAAHCMIGASPHHFQVRYGFLRQSETDLKVVNVVEIVTHAEFDSYYLVNDIALLRVEPNIILSNCVREVRLPNQDFVKIHDDARGTVIGWGLNEYHYVPDTLQKVNLRIGSKSRCKQMYKEDFQLTNLCAGSKGFGKDSCQGDSGGPLLINNIQVGIVSWGNTICGGKPYSGIYTDVSFYLDWISAKLAIHGYKELQAKRKKYFKTLYSLPYRSELILATKPKNHKKCFKYGIRPNARLLLASCV